MRHVVVRVQIAQVDDLLTELRRHEHDGLRRQVAELLDGADTEPVHEAGGPPVRDADSAHRKPERPHSFVSVVGVKRLVLSMKLDK